MTYCLRIGPPLQFSTAESSSSLEEGVKFLSEAGTILLYSALAKSFLSGSVKLMSEMRANGTVL